MTKNIADCLNEVLGNRYTEIDLNGDIPFIPDNTSGLSSCLRQWDSDKIEEASLEEKIDISAEKLIKRFSKLASVCDYAREYSAKIGGLIFFGEFLADRGISGLIMGGILGALPVVAYNSMGKEYNKWTRALKGINHNKTLKELYNPHWHKRARMWSLRRGVFPIFFLVYQAGITGALLGEGAAYVYGEKDEDRARVIELQLMRKENLKPGLSYKAYVKEEEDLSIRYWFRKRN